MLGQLLLRRTLVLLYFFASFAFPASTKPDRLKLYKILIALLEVKNVAQWFADERNANHQ